MDNASTEKFNISQAAGVFNYVGKCIYLTKAKTSPGQVEFESWRKITRRSLEHLKPKKYNLFWILEPSRSYPRRSPDAFFENIHNMF